MATYIASGYFGWIVWQNFLNSISVLDVFCRLALIEIDAAVTLVSLLRDKSVHGEVKCTFMQLRIQRHHQRTLTQQRFLPASNFFFYIPR